MPKSRIPSVPRKSRKASSLALATRYLFLWNAKSIYYCRNCKKMRSFYWQYCLHCEWENPVLMRQPSWWAGWGKAVLGGLALVLGIIVIAYGYHWLWGTRFPGLQ